MAWPTVHFVLPGTIEQYVNLPLISRVHFPMYDGAGLHDTGLAATITVQVSHNEEAVFGAVTGTPRVFDVGQGWYIFTPHIDDLQIPGTVVWRFSDPGPAEDTFVKGKIMQQAAYGGTV